MFVTLYAADDYVTVSCGSFIQRSAAGGNGAAFLCGPYFCADQSIGA